MKTYTLSTRIVLVAMAALLALPIAQLASPVGAKQRSRTVTRTFANTAPIEIPISTLAVVPAQLYPSPIAVSGQKGKIRDANVYLNDFSHTFPDDVEVLLVGPSGQTAVVMANAGGGTTDVDDVTLRLDDEANEPLPAQAMLQSGAFRPTNVTGSAIAFFNPAPEASGSSALSVFDGGNPNGTWRLFVQDDEGTIDSGVFAGGWRIEIEARVKHKRDRKR